MVSIVAPRLPLLPAFNGKLTNRSDSFSRSPCCPHCVNASQVSTSAVFRSTDVCRFDLDAAASTAGSNDSVRTFRGVPAWLRAVHES